MQKITHERLTVLENAAGVLQRIAATAPQTLPPYLQEQAVDACRALEQTAYAKQPGMGDGWQAVEKRVQF